MALDRSQRYPGRWLAPSADFPLGGPKNRTSPSSGDGSYFSRDWIADYEAFFGALLNDAGEAVNNVADTAQASQLHNAMMKRRPVENRFKGNQNWNVAGSTGDPLPSATPTLYTIGAEIAAGRFVVDANLVNATYTDGLFDADSGSYYIEYEGDFTSDFYGLKLADDTVTQTGCSISIESGKTRVTVDMSVAPAHKFLQFSENLGVSPDVSDDESRSVLHNHSLALRTIQNVSGSRVSGVTYTNLTPTDIELEIWFTGSVGNEVSADLTVDGETVGNVRLVAGVNSPIATLTATVPPGKDYVCNSAFITSWNELRI